MVAAGADVCVAGIMGCIKPGCKVPLPHPTHGTADCISRVLLAGIPLVPVHPEKNGINARVPEDPRRESESSPAEAAPQAGPLER